LSNTSLAPFIKWGNYKSQDPKSPDVLELQISEVETFETPYSVNVRVRQNEGEDWNDKILPLKSHESANTILIKEWDKWVNKKAIKIGKRFLLKTWLDRTKKTNRPLRRFVLEFL
jgi:flavin-dependent dehydrogenase